MREALLIERIMINGIKVARGKRVLVKKVTSEYYDIEKHPSERDRLLDKRVYPSVYRFIQIVGEMKESLTANEAVAFYC